MGWAGGAVILVASIATQLGGAMDDEASKKKEAESYSPKMKAHHLAKAEEHKERAKENEELAKHHEEEAKTAE